jgi:hypothetical protein
MDAVVVVFPVRFTATGSLDSWLYGEEITVFKIMSNVNPPTEMLAAW